MSTAIQQEPIIGREPTKEELELVAWAEEAVSKSLGTVQEGLRQMVTLTTALLAGSAALIDKLPLALGCKALSVLLLVLALASALWGALPQEATLDVRCPDEIKAVRDRGRRWKMNCLKFASGCLLAAFLVMLGGLLARL